VLLLNGGDPTTVSSNTTFTFATILSPYTSYAVTVGIQPAGQTCTVANGSGESFGFGSISNVSVTCAVKFIYVSASAGPNTFPAAIYGFAVNSSGALSPVPGSPAPTADGGGPIAITRDSKLLYTTSTGTGELFAFPINADGSLTNAPNASGSTADYSVGLVAHRTADFLYASGNSGVLTVLAIDSATGALSQASSVTLSNEFLKNSAVITPNGRYLYQNDLDRNDDLFPASLQIAGFSTDAATGALSPVPGSPLTLTTPSPSTTSGTGPMAIDPTGKFLYVPYQFVVVNVGSDGGLAAYSIDAASGALTAVPGSPFGVGGAPNSVAIDASGRFLIVSIYPLGGGSRLAMFSIDPGTGALTSVPGSFGPTYVWEGLAADPSGPYFYAGASSNHYPGQGPRVLHRADPLTSLWDRLREFKFWAERSRALREFFTSGSYVCLAEI
jgi:6-phosphogluconolactonase (cycloisomerase 2 family)